ncbi:hypothetical protein PQG02_09360 [Nostoc sp. UHCC 0926]|uniref:hypothetical protein n=1 Tax=unclassified Nostoc TaxID=2593658 RepID=UPI00235EA050|nr:hypothetical protein [Nostoc sp. UHCC 0926]WDD34510.1 hypothetical protein PQG02_09360 [Nostoc sp. UHCC 0926]
MLDWLAIWGVTQATGLIFKPILEDLAIPRLYHCCAIAQRMTQMSKCGNLLRRS